MSRAQNLAVSYPSLTEVPNLIDASFKTGDIIWSCRGAAPAKFLQCNGSAISRTTYAALFAAIGTTFGAGNGTTTFNLPDARGRAPVGAGTGTGLTARALGAAGGAETHVLAEAELPSHTHQTSYGTTTPSAVDTSGSGEPRNPLAYSAGAALNTVSSAAGSGTSHNNMQPFLALNAFIYAAV